MKTKITAFALVDKRGKVIRWNENYLQPFLLFDRKRRAEAAKFEPTEKIVEVTITIRDTK